MTKVQQSRLSLSLPLILDVFERAALFIVFLSTCMRFYRDMHGAWSIIDSALLVSEGAAVFFILTHRFTQNVSLRPADWAVTLIGTFFPLLVRPSDTGAFLPLSICAALMAAGFLLQIMAKLTLRRSFGLVPANRGIKIGGPYRLLRHPMYAGYLMTHLAFMGAHPTLWNLVIYLTAFTAQCFRLMAEERVLSEDEEYRAFMKTTRWRLIPFLF
jgi:protein-S-isoprenylcysteine O-methyltransferase Ste14